MIPDTSALAAIFFGEPEAALYLAHPRRRPLPDERRKLC